MFSMIGLFQNIWYNLFFIHLFDFTNYLNIVLFRLTWFLDGLLTLCFLNWWKYYMILKRFLGLLVSFWLVFFLTCLINALLLVASYSSLVHVTDILVHLGVDVYFHICHSWFEYLLELFINVMQLLHKHKILYQYHN